MPSLSEIGDLSCITSCLVLPGFLMDTLLVSLLNRRNEARCVLSSALELNKKPSSYARILGLSLSTPRAYYKYLKRQQSSPFYTDKLFSLYKFLVQLVFAPRFKQRHIPRYNYIKRQQQKNPLGIVKSNDPWMRLTCCIKEMQNPLFSDRWHDRRFDTKVKCPSG